MNVPAATRRDQLKVNIERLKTLTTNLGPRYVVVNIPAARVEAIENDVAVQRHTAVVGKPDRPSPDINSKIVADQFQSVLDRAGVDRAQGFDSADAGQAGLSDREPHPHLRRAAQRSAALADQLVFGRRGPLHVPGGSRRHNSLGRIRINFPSPYGVYMHDTPLKNLFGDDFRYNSSGCCRVQNVRQLVDWLLDETKGWTSDEIDQAIESGEQVNAQLDQASAAALGLCHRVVGVRRRRAIPRRHL